MKKIILGLMLIASTFVANAHNVSPMCWSNGAFSFNATQVPSGIATVRVYANSSYNNASLLYTTTFVVTGNVATFSVTQTTRTTRVWVKVTWSDGFINRTVTNTNQCSVQAILSLEVLSAKNVGNNTVIYFKGESTTNHEQVTLNFMLPSGEFKYYNVVFLDVLKPEDIWEVTINNKTNQVLTVKKK